MDDRYTCIFIPCRAVLLCRIVSYLDHVVCNAVSVFQKIGHETIKSRIQNRVILYHNVPNSRATLEPCRSVSYLATVNTNLELYAHILNKYIILKA
jgi:hypothetical protein